MRAKARARDFASSRELGGEKGDTGGSDSEFTDHSWPASLDGRRKRWSDVDVNPERVLSRLVNRARIAARGPSTETTVERCVTGNHQIEASVARDPLVPIASEAPRAAGVPVK